MEDFFTAITNFGFPIVLSAYLLLRFEKKLDDLTQSIDKLDGSISDLVRDSVRK